jgi:hypothetical protein
MKTTITIGYFTWRPVDIFNYISLLLLRLRNVLCKSFRRNQNTHFVQCGPKVLGLIFFKTRRHIHHTGECGRPQTAIWRMRIAFWIPKATDTHSEHVIIAAFPLQQWLQERAWVLRYACLACMVGCNFFLFANLHQHLRESYVHFVLLVTVLVRQTDRQTRSDSASRVF